jgi:hypothetical protein
MFTERRGGTWVAVRRCQDQAKKRNGECDGASLSEAVIDDLSRFSSISRAYPLNDLNEIFVDLCLNTRTL